MNKINALFPLTDRRIYSYAEYIELIEKLVSEGKTTGEKQSESLSNYTRLNLARMNRLNKTTVVTDTLLNVTKSIDIPQTWYVLTEAWCGDAAQNIPVLAAIVKHNSLINLELLLRDENLDLMDAFLTNGGRSIPKLIATDGQNNILFTWGPRPAGAMELFQNYKNSTNKSYSEYSEELQRWYNSDKTISVQNELQTILEGVLADC